MSNIAKINFSAAEINEKLANAIDAKYVDATNNIFIRYSANSYGTGMTEEWSEGQNYIGFATGQTAPTEKEAYTWVYMGSDLPLEKGTGDNTVQQDGCITGVKGFYWKSIDINAKTITLSTVNGEFGNEQSFDISNYWAIGDVITIHSNKKWDKCSTITALSGNNITVNSLPFSNPTAEETHFTDQAVFVPSKPDKGIVDFGKYSVAFGENSKATNYNAVAFGRNNEAYGQYAFTAGRDNKAGYATFVLGRENTATGEQSFIIGYKNKSSGANSFVSGRENTASGIRTFVSGYKSTASGDCALAGGENANATNISSVAFGKDVYASGKYSVALGIGTLAREYAATAVGNNTCALASGAFACGKLTYASGQNSFVSGVGNKDDGNTQAIFGSYNARNDNAVMLVGNGSGSDSRSNAFEVIEKDGVCSIKVGNTEITEEQLNKLLDLLEPKTIKFTYNGDEFYAYDGMTWREFCESSLNHDIGFGISSAGKLLDWNGMDIGLNGTIVNPDDVIIEDGSYEEYI